MSTTLEQLLTRYVYTQLQDNEDFRRWTRDEITQYVNFAMRDLVARRPEAGAVTNHAMALVAGMRQTLPAGSVRLKEIIRNVSGLEASLYSRQAAEQETNSTSARLLVLDGETEQLWADEVSGTGGLVVPP